jgi:hypothetical protein
VGDVCKNKTGALT